MAHEQRVRNPVAPDLNSYALVPEVPEVDPRERELAGMTRSQLHARGAERGFMFKSKATKGEMIERLVAG
jgi:hypothetical protein